MAVTGRIFRIGLRIKPWMLMMVFLVSVVLTSFFVGDLVQTSEASHVKYVQVVIDIEPIRQSVTLGETIILRASFENEPVGDNVTYTWLSLNGSIDARSPCSCATVLYTAPEEPNSEVIRVFATWAAGMNSSYSVAFDIYSPG